MDTAFNFEWACKGIFNHLPYSACPPSSHSPCSPYRGLPPSLPPPVSDWRCRSNGRVEVSILLLPARFVSFPAVRICVLWLCCSALLNTCLVLLLCSHVFALLHALGSPIRLNSPPGSASGQRHVHDVWMFAVVFVNATLIPSNTCDSLLLSNI